MPIISGPEPADSVVHGSRGELLVDEEWRQRAGARVARSHGTRHGGLVEARGGQSVPPAGERAAVCGRGEPVASRAAAGVRGRRARRQVAARRPQPRLRRHHQRVHRGGTRPTGAKWAISALNTLQTTVYVLPIRIA